MTTQNQSQTAGPRYPEAVAQLSRHDGNAFAIFGAVTTALKRAGVDPATRDEYLAEAMSGDYDNVIQTSMRWVTVL